MLGTGPVKPHRTEHVQAQDPGDFSDDPLCPGPSVWCGLLFLPGGPLSVLQESDHTSPLLLWTPYRSQIGCGNEQRNLGLKGPACSLSVSCPSFREAPWRVSTERGFWLEAHPALTTPPPTILQPRSLPTAQARLSLETTAHAPSPNDTTCT